MTNQQGKFEFEMVVSQGDSLGMLLRLLPEGVDPWRTRIDSFKNGIVVRFTLTRVDIEERLRNLRWKAPSLQDEISFLDNLLTEGQKDSAYRPRVNAPIDRHANI